MVSGLFSSAGRRSRPARKTSFALVLFRGNGFHDHAAYLLGVGFVHGEPPAVALENFSLFGDMPGLKAQVAADGVHLVGLQPDAEFFKVFQIGAPGQECFSPRPPWGGRPGL